MQDISVFDIIEETNKSKKLLRSLNKARYQFYEENYILKFEAQQKDENFYVPEKLDKIYLLDNQFKIYTQLNDWEKNNGDIKKMTDDEWLINYVNSNIKPGEFIIQYYQVNWDVCKKLQNKQIALGDRITIDGTEYYVADTLFFVNTLIADINYFKDYFLSLYN